MNKAEIEIKFYSLISDMLMKEISLKSVKPETTLTDLGMDSFAYVKLGVKIEDEFGLDLSLQELNFENNTFETIQAAIDFIYNKLN